MDYVQAACHLLRKLEIINALFKDAPNILEIPARLVESPIFRLYQEDAHTKTVTKFLMENALVVSMVLLLIMKDIVIKLYKTVKLMTFKEDASSAS